MDGIDWTFVLEILALTAAGTRLLAWCLAHRKALLVLAAVIEQLAGGGVKRNVEDRLADKPAARNVVEAVAAKVERALGHDEGRGAARRRRKTKGKRALREVGRWLPVIGAFLP